MSASPIQWTVPAPPRYAHTKLIDPDMWPVAATDFRAEVGSTFTAGPLPVLGGPFSGRLQCTVSAVAPRHSISFQVILETRSQMPMPTCWTASFTLKDGPRGPLVDIAVLGADPADRHQQNLLHCLKACVEWTCADVQQESLKPPQPLSATSQRAVEIARLEEWWWLRCTS